MNAAESSNSDLSELRKLLNADDADPSSVAREAHARTNSNAGRNVYLSFDREWTLAEAAALPESFPDKTKRPPLYGLPISLKDCFDLAGFPTTCGSRFYAEHIG